MCACGWGGGGRSVSYVARLMGWGQGLVFRCGLEVQVLRYDGWGGVHVGLMRAHFLVDEIVM